MSKASNQTFYITTTLPYVNADPHIGFALEVVQADILARYNRLLGRNVFFNTGTDEHGFKIYEKALSEGKDTQEYVDYYAKRFGDLKNILGLSYDNFIRTTDSKHKRAAQEFWKKCETNGDIYKKAYKGLYCVSDELFISEKDLVGGRCPNHPTKDLVELEEENYFFKFSNYQDELLKLYENNKEFVVPESRLNEVRAFVASGLEDFSISRLKDKMPWGVPVPGDENHVMYVWFDALVNYISAIGWPDDMDNFDKWWPVIQIAGKDNNRQQSAMWQAMLMSAGIIPSKQILIHGFITSGGHKMSKSVGNVINPLSIVEEYGTDALRYYLAREVHPFEDSDFTEERFKETYNANLANGLGNLVSRIMKMATSYGVVAQVPDGGLVGNNEDSGWRDVSEKLDQYKINEAMDAIWKEISNLDLFIQKTEPFKLIKTDEKKAKEIVEKLVKGLWSIAFSLFPFMPETSGKIKTAIKENKMPEPLFLRVE